MKTNFKDTESLLYTCCCAHDHDSDCLLKELAEEYSWEDVHEIHTPDSSCLCKNGHKLLHDENC
jgi:hypothetical protein